VLVVPDGDVLDVVEQLSADVSATSTTAPMLLLRRCMEKIPTAK